MMFLLGMATHSPELMSVRFPARSLAAFLFLCILHGTPNQALGTWKKRTKQFVKSTLLSIGRNFERANATYVLVIPMSSLRKRKNVLDLKKFYVGSTKVTCHSRQDARIRKYRLLKEGQFTNTELMVHYFHVHGDLFDAVMIPLSFHKSVEEARTQECNCIHLWKPQLNAPWVAKLNPTSATRATSMTLNSTIYATPGKRLWMKVRRRLQTLGILSLYPVAPTNPFDNWSILVQLARGDRQTFEAEKTLRSAQFHSQHVFALLRMTMLLDDPPRTRVRSILKRVLSFRDCPPPPSTKPLVLPMLGHRDFKERLQRWIVQKVQEHKPFLVPFHLPGKSVVVGKLPSIRDILYNHLSMIQQWSWDNEPPCKCQQQLRLHPDLEVVDGHIASPAAKLNISKRLSTLLYYSADAQVYPAKEKYIKNSWDKIKQWAKHYGLNNITFEQWQQFINLQWKDHTEATWTSMKYKDIAFLKKVTQEFFVHGRDHAVTHCHIYCQLFAWKVYKQTFGDPAVYERLTLTIPQAKVYVDLTTKKSFLQKYKWGVNTTTSTLPIAYLLFKKKKQYRAARPIISYLSFVYAKLFKATAIVIDLLVHEVCPDSFGCTRLPQIMQSLTQFMRNFPDDQEPVVYNQDLVGFFTSIPVDRILQSIQWLIDQYLAKRRDELEDVIFSVNLREKDTQLRIWKGKQRKAAMKVHKILLKDVLEICRLSCEVSMFTVLGQTFRQTRGAAIGNQISPTLANATVAVYEQMFADKINYLFRAHSQNLWCIRYVDNRLVVMSKQLYEDPDIRNFLDDNFYQEPVVLESVTTTDASQEFLGFDVQVESYKILLLLREAPWKIRPYSSAGTLRQKLSAYNSKKLSIVKFVFPESQKSLQLAQLKTIFNQAGYALANL